MKTRDTPKTGKVSATANADTSRLSWAFLTNAVCTLKPTGIEGFEGLVGRLFEALIGAKFFLARAGDQPSGDAYSSPTGIALQAKRYKAATISETEVEGDIHRALREVPDLDVFVVATTKPSAQLASRLHSVTQETALDVVLVELGDGPSPFGALCVANWNLVREFGICREADWTEWAEKQAIAPESQGALKQLQDRLQGLSTRAFVSARAFEHLQCRFRGEGAGARLCNRIRLEEATARSNIQAALNAWRENMSAPIAVLVGEEGTGKTWVAAAFVAGFDRAEAPVVFWLDSIAWEGVKSVEELVECALCDIFPGEEALRSRVKRKIFQHWSGDVYFVLDGANERRAWTSAERLLLGRNALFRDSGARVRVLFTSRPTGLNAGPSEGFWSECELIPVGPFSESEFRVALTAAAPLLDPDAVLRAVGHLAQLPRYFGLCVALWPRLKSVQNLTLHLLLWMDLEQKLAARDPQLLEVSLELRGEPEAILAQLAKTIGWPTSGGGVVAIEQLEKCFPKFRDVQQDLAEQRVIRESDFESTTVSPDHVVLGWALVLKAVAFRYAGEAVHSLRDRLIRELEPAPSNDDKVRALQVATLLTFLQKRESSPELTRARAALLGLWVTHHNARPIGDGLQFFLDGDMEAYLHAVECMFMSHLPGGIETTLIAPVASAWKQAGKEATVVRGFLERWLRFVFPGGVEGSKDRDCDAPERFCEAQSAEQLRLAYVAISIVSFRPDPAMLPALLDCVRSDSFCYVDVQVGGEPRRHALKYSGSHLGLLFRWGYTEQILPELEGAMKSEEDAERRRDIRWVSKLLCQSRLPESLGPAEEIELSQPQSQEKWVRDFQHWLVAEEPESRAFLGMGWLAGLPVRRDLPELDEAAVNRLRTVGSQLQQNVFASGDSADGWAERMLEDISPWLARYAPAEFHHLEVARWRGMINQEDSRPAMLSLRSSLPGTRDARTLLPCLLQSEQALKGWEHFEYWAIGFTELMLLHGSMEEITAWLRAIAGIVTQRSGDPLVALQPLGMAFKTLAPAGLAKVAKAELEKTLSRWGDDSGEGEARRAGRHWLTVLANLVDNDDDTVEWALKLADRFRKEDEMDWPLCEIISGTSNPALLMKGLTHPLLQRYGSGYNSWKWGRNVPAEYLSEMSSEELLEASLTVAGNLFVRTGNDGGIRKWGQGLAEVSRRVLTAGEHRKLHSRLVFSVDEEDHVGGVSYKDPPDGGQEWHAVSSPAWGIDRHTNRKTPTNVERSQALDLFRDDTRELRASAWGFLAQFDAFDALVRWSDLAPAEFGDFAEMVLAVEATMDLSDRLRLSWFCSAVQVALARMEPAKGDALKAWDASPHTGSVLTRGTSMSWRTRRLWLAELSQRPGIERIRRQLLLQAVDDEMLLWHVLAARLGNSVQSLNMLISEFLVASVARERALGATLLSFIGDGSALTQLQNLAETDLSWWVRDQAQWGCEVCVTELACQTRYAEALSAGTLEAVAAALAEIEPATTPLVWAWKGSIEESCQQTNADSRIQGYLSLFWYHWSCLSSHTRNIEVHRRKLSEFCRGERIENGVASRHAHWWRLEDEDPCSR